MVLDKQFARRIEIVRAIESLGLDNYDDVSIASICSAVNISRTTFYRAFSSLHEIPSWWEHTVSHTVGLYQIGRTAGVLEADGMGLRVLSQARTLLLQLVRTWSTEYTRRSIDEQVFEWKRTLEDYHGVVVDRRMDYMLRASAYQIHETTADWANAGFDITPDELADIHREAMPDCLVRVFDAPPVKDVHLEKLDRAAYAMALGI